MIASVVLSTRWRAAPVWLGVAGAFLLHVVMAATIGGAVANALPKNAVIAATAVLFLIGGLVMLRAAGKAGDGEDVDVERGATSTARMLAGSFVVIFVSEWGDLTQLATINLTARYGDPWSVGLGATAALWSVSGLGVVFGHRLLRRIPVRLLRRTSAAVLLALGAGSIIELLR